MSEMTSDVMVKNSSVNVEAKTSTSQVVGSTDSVKRDTIKDSKLKRKFSFGRSALSVARMKKKKQMDANSASSNLAVNDINDLDSKNNKVRFLRPSWTKFINKVVQKVSNLSVHNNKNLYSSYAYNGRRMNNLSLSSTDLRVPPTRPVYGDKVPGVIGLRNHGNTCFINAVLQCLSHTDVLAQYFVLDQYKADLSRRNKLNSKKYGTKGEVTQHLALLLKSIWSCQYDPEISNKFKLIVDKYGSQFRGNNQHDAQEFLLWLLDKVHEDLNTASKKKYKTIKNVGRPDDVVAAETLANHVRQNDSFVLGLFQAQFRSSLTCPRCHRQSNTFDPFLCVSVPVPQDQLSPVFVTVLYTSQLPRQVKLGLSLPAHAEIRDLKEQLASDTGVEEKHMLITEIDDIGFQRTFSDNQPMSMIKDSDPLYCLELPQLKEATQDTGEYILLVWINTLVMGDHCSRFGSPYVMQICRETSYIDLEKLMLKEMCWIVADGVLESDRSKYSGELRMRVVAPGCGISYLDPSMDHPLYAQAVDTAIALCDNVPIHLKLILEWDIEAKQNMIAEDTDQVEEHSSVRELRQSAETGASVTLEECFQLYTRAEVLGAEDAWHCPNCNLKQEVVKKLGLWSLPDVLVIHLKRFRHPPLTNNNRSTIKLTTLVEFPSVGFDMSPHVVCSGGGGNAGSGVWWGSRQDTTPGPHPNMYDLYAVCNHHGHNLHTGHYTAYCRNPYNGEWYCFDDTTVTPLNERELVTPSAYILFYQRRSPHSAHPQEHWASRIASALNSTQPSPQSERDKKMNDTEGTFKRNSRQYSTAPAIRSNNRSLPLIESQDNTVKEEFTYNELNNMTNYDIPESIV